MGRPFVGNRDAFLERLNDILDSGRLTNSGPYEQEFESRLARLLGVRHCVAMCNGTAALEILLRALELTGEVIVPSFTFVATAHAVEWQHLTPIFCDIDPSTHNLDPNLVERLITPRTSGIIGVHLWGRPCDVDALAAVAARHKLALIFDAAHALGCTSRGRMIGGFGRAEVFSFHATKVLNTFEGGAVTTQDDDLAAKLRMMRTFGFTGYDRVESVGTNAKMSEVAAAMGLTSLESLDEFIGSNRRRYAIYREQLAGTPGIRLVEYNDGEKGNYQYVVVEIDERLCGLSRDHVHMVLTAENILARRYFFPGCHRVPPYADRPDRQTDLPNTDAVAARVLCLPSGWGSDNDIETVVRIIKLAVENASIIAAALRPGTAVPGS